ncbi:hypothetical protein [Hymenobacter sp. BT491]|uniref:hypothetical protein n=1 Tax=Hymenobacter sp. BT491 TaxID=2766779 RepID=UPI001653CDBD|nr:hypothetical protein [Hymenobacter sp. BT491]MBC6988548.1 hypothetical protein [Hymenobacter sp. BT491]
MSNEVESKPCVAEKLVGTEIEVRYGRNPKKRRTVKGIIQAWRYGTGVIEKMSPPEDGSPRLCWPSFEIKIKPEDGSKAVWVGPFKDSNNPQPSEIH